MPLLIEAERVENNRDEILKWVKANENTFKLELDSTDSRSVVVEFPEYIGDLETKRYVESSLYAARFRFEINDA